MAFSWDIRRNGYVRASDLQPIFDELAKAISERLTEQDEEIEDLRRQVSKQKTELEAERRLRLGMKR